MKGMVEYLNHLEEEIFKACGIPKRYLNQKIKIMKEKTLSEVYKNSSLEVKEILMTKFSNSELGLEINKEDFKEYFLELLGSYKSIRFINKNGNISQFPTKRYELLDENGNWLFQINLNPNMMDFWYSYYRIWLKLQSRFGGNYEEINGLINGILDETIELKGLTPTDGYMGNVRN